MKTKKLFPLFFAFLFFASSSFASEDKSFAIIIPSSNNQEWVKRTLDSLFSQTYQQFRAVYIDDASTDDTANLVQEYIQKHALVDRLTLIQNETPQGILSCLNRAILFCSPEEIVIPLYGTDWLAHRDVLARLNTLYSDPDVWLTYSQYLIYPDYNTGSAVPIPQSVIDRNAFRSEVKPSGSLRSFYASLFLRIKNEDLAATSQMPRSTADLCFLLPLLEMAGSHSRYVPAIDSISNFTYTTESDAPLRSKQPYTQLSHCLEQIPLKKIYITPGYWGELFSISNPFFNRDNCLEVLYRLRAIARNKGFELHQTHDLYSLHDFEYLIVFDIFEEQQEALARYPKEKKILFLWEPPSVLPENFNTLNHASYSKVYTWDDTLVDNRKYFKFTYPVMRPMIQDTLDFHSKNLCTLIACNKYSSYPGELYSERSALIGFYENSHYDGFTLYGRGWPSTYRTYGGSIDKKVDILKHYRFCYAYENISTHTGYITEKIFDCFHAGTVPIYWGAPNISSYIPKSCYIDRLDFPTDEALYSYLQNMDEPRYQNYVQNIRKFLSSGQAARYSQDSFIFHFIQLISTNPKD